MFVQLSLEGLRLEQQNNLSPVLFYYNKITTSNNGYLGSRIDEDRSEFRYLMRIAGFVNHQIVERILHFFTREVSLFECVLKSLESLGFQLVGRDSSL